MKPLLPIETRRPLPARIWPAAPILLLCLVARAALAEPTAPPAKPASQEESPALKAVAFVKSAFVDAPVGDKDPFFPKS